MLQSKNKASQAYGAMQIDEVRLVRENQSLVNKIAWQIKSFSPEQIELEDLIQVGLVAMVEAAGKYVDQGHNFSTYLYVRVRGAMIDYLRTTCSLRRSAVEWNKNLRRVSDQLAQQNGREPNEVELAEAMGIDQAEFRKNADRAADIHVDSLDEVYSDSSSWFTDDEDDQHEALEKSQMIELLSANLKKLNEREQMVLNSYFIEEMQLDEIGAVLDVSSVRICQIKKRALEKLQAAMTSE
ncbi:sigma-70 family RNA polymerase sigma factor [Parasphingorhabdus cellanae]|uniref:Sigma-70 family RNA polymerase sigma factor n=1 Tax=Parasphingorhabdus cellanae TaxID=2806553 RepID=A0ABX7T1K0_9SPHN|nr:sigma-70 family RNA polymerase sigma factor [Parasphingorhabdus cellanae]QTD55448.1 sigma-70 family RNA polymerase sigma factor [Parasphingorhabdus cellanae]